MLVQRITRTRVAAVTENSLHDPPRVCEPFGVDIDERKVRVLQMGISQDVRCQSARKNQTAGPDDRDTRDDVS